MPIIFGHDYYKVKECRELEKKADEILFLRSYSPTELKRAVGYYRKAVDNSDYYFGGSRPFIRQKLIYALILAGHKNEAKLECKKLSPKVSPYKTYFGDTGNSTNNSVKNKQK